MQDLYKVLQDPSIRVLQDHEIKYFDDLIKEYPENYKKIICYINDSFNYSSPYHVVEKEWGSFLKERGKANGLTDELFSKIINNEILSIVYAIQEYVFYQKEKVFATKVAKENLRIYLLKLIQSDAALSEMKIANEMITDLDLELQKINERIKQDQKVFGGYKGFDSISKIKNPTRINIGDD